MLNRHNGRCAITPFAVFTSILLIDVRAQFLRAPEAVFAHSEFLDTDTISSHDTTIQKGLYVIALRRTKSGSDTAAVRDGAKVKSGGGELCQGVQFGCCRAG